MKQPRETIHIPLFKMNNRSDRTNKKNKHIKFQTRCQRINHAQIDAMIATDQGAHKICMSDSRKIERERSTTVLVSQALILPIVPFIGELQRNWHQHWQDLSEFRVFVDLFSRRCCCYCESISILFFLLRYIHNKFNRLCEWKIKATEKSILLSHLIHAITIKRKIFSSFDVSFVYFRATNHKCFGYSQERIGKKGKWIEKKR